MVECWNARLKRRIQLNPQQGCRHVLRIAKKQQLKDMLCSLNPSTQYNGLDEHSKDISRKMHVLYVCGFQLVSITD